MFVPSTRIAARLVSLFTAKRHTRFLVFTPATFPARAQGSAEEQAPDQSIFRRQFIEAIEGEADANTDSYITGTELGDFLQDKVINYSRNAQHPQYGKIKNPNLDQGDFVFSLPLRTALPDASAPQVETGNNRTAPGTTPQQRSSRR